MSGYLISNIQAKYRFRIVQSKHASFPNCTSEATARSHIDDELIGRCDHSSFFRKMVGIRPHIRCIRIGGGLITAGIKKVQWNGQRPRYMIVDGADKPVVSLPTGHDNVFTDLGVQYFRFIPCGGHLLHEIKTGNSVGISISWFSSQPDIGFVV